MLRLLGERPGSLVTWVVFSANEEREREARASAGDFLQGSEATVVVHGFRESYLPYTASEVKDAFEQLKPTVEPDLIFTHRRADRHQDHRLVAELTWNTFRDHLILEYEIPKYEGDLGHPNVYFALSRSVADRKVELLHRHFLSQRGRTWFDAETFQGLLTLRGIECNAKDRKAEAFSGFKIAV